MQLVENLDSFLDEFAVSFTVAGNSFKGIFEVENSPIGFDAEGRRITLTAKTTDTNGINHGTPLVVGAKTYTVIGLEPIDDGKFTDLVLKE
jgi:hypothetical protein